MQKCVLLLQRRFPDFSYVTQNGRLTDFLDCVIIRFVAVLVFFTFFPNQTNLLLHICSSHSHFHLDHCGALPYMSEMVGYDGPIYMTHPTKAICPILLEDFRKITVDKKGETNFFTSQMIKDCMKKVVPLNLHQTVQVIPACYCYVCSSFSSLLMVNHHVGVGAFRWTMSWRSRRITRDTSWELPWCTSKWDRSPSSTP